MAVKAKIYNAIQSDDRNVQFSFYNRLKSVVGMRCIAEHVLNRWPMAKEDSI